MLTVPLNSKVLFLCLCNKLVICPYTGWCTGMNSSLLLQKLMLLCEQTARKSVKNQDSYHRLSKGNFGNVTPTSSATRLGSKHHQILLVMCVFFTQNISDEQLMKSSLTQLC